MFYLVLLDCYLVFPTVCKARFSLVFLIRLPSFTGFLLVTTSFNHILPSITGSYVVLVGFLIVTESYLVFSVWIQFLPAFNV